MRISQLSGQTGVPVATVKYYLREGLLPPGERTAANQASYGTAHVERLRLIRALVEVGGVPLAGVKAVLASLEQPPGTLHDLLGTVQDAITPRPQRAGGPDWDDARADVARLVEDLGWQIRRDAPALDQLTDVLLAYRAVTGADLDPGACFGAAARTAAQLAAAEVPNVTGEGPAETARNLVVGTVLGGRAFDVLRRLAHEDVSSRLLGSAPGGDGMTHNK